MKTILVRFLFGLLLVGLLISHAQAQTSAGSSAPGNVIGTVNDSANGRPLDGAEVILLRGGNVAGNTATDQFGRFRLDDVAPGDYSIQARFLGYAIVSQDVTVAAGSIANVAFLIAPQAVGLKPITVTAQAAVAVDSRSGDQVFKKNDYHGAPTTTTSQIVQQSIAGAVRAPTGEVHIRGQHAEYTYYIDGVPVAPGISGGLNELFDPAVVNRIDFQTGGWDAEYGGKNTAVINVQTRVPVGPFHADASAYGGSFNSNGQGLNLSGNNGKLGWFVSGNRQETAMRQEPVVADPDKSPINFHNEGHDLTGFGKLQYVPNDHDIVNLAANWSRSRTSVPFDSTGGVVLDDRQQDLNSFVNLGWSHLFTQGTISGENNADLFAGFYYRHGSLAYTPGEIDEPSFIFYPDPTAYNLQESRSFDAEGARVILTDRLRHQVQFKVGVEGSTTSGHELFVTTDADGNHGPESNSDLKGHDIGAFAQTVLEPAEWVELRLGGRYDSHDAPFAGTLHQLSPRVKLSAFPNQMNTLYMYYGRLFLPTNIEDLRAITEIADSGVVADPTVPERDDFYEVGFIHRMSFVVTKLSVYRKESLPGIDDNTVPGSAIVTSVNLARVRVTGLEAVVEVQPRGPLSGYLNLAICHAYGRGPITGGFFPQDPADVPGTWFDLDHDQRVSAVASAVYNQKGLFVSATGIYGSGLTNGADIETPIKLGLFDPNKDIHVDPNFILNASAGYTLTVGTRTVRPEIYVDNVFGTKYALKGAFFSGASWGRPRSVQVRLNVGV